MHPRVLSEDAWEVVRRLESAGVLRDWTLAGGTGLALQFGHRYSEDIDLFRPDSVDAARLVSALAAIGETDVQSRSDDTLHAVLDGLRVSFLAARPPLLFPGTEYRGLSVADPRDIAVMKIVAIGGRGSRKDFVDLYFYLKSGATLSGVFTLLERNFTSLNYNEYHLLKSLAYFDDAELEPMPRMIRKVEWSEIRSHVEEEVRRLS
ncbi:MAG: nucleotidyl transferase AbiEii/AbiGii toxin family protein [Gemmatimonadota bacterium]|jgi:hypothetical protein